MEGIQSAESSVRLGLGKKSAFVREKDCVLV